MKYFKNTSWLFAEKILRMAVGLFVGIWVARYLGPERFGLLSYAQSFVFLFTAIATLGLDSIVIRELVKDESRRDILLGTTFLLKLIGACAVLLVLAIAINFTSNDRYTNILVFIVASATIFQSFNVINFYFQSKVLSRYVVFANIISLFISSILKIILILNEAPLIAFAYVILFDSLVLAIGYLYFFLYNHLSLKNWKFQKSVAINLLKDSWPMILSGVAIAIALRIDQVMIKGYIDTINVGYYATGVKLAEAFAFIPMIISQSLFPKLISMNFVQNQSKLIKLFRYIFFILVIMAIMINLTSEFIVLTLFGADFIESYKILDIIIWTIPFSYLGIITNNLLLKENNQKIIFLKQVLLTIFNITLNIILIPCYGIVGSAFATLISDIIINLIFDLVLLKTRWIFYLKLNALLFIKIKKKIL